MPGGGSQPADIRAHLSPAPPRSRRHPWAWVLAVLVHLVVILLAALLWLRPSRPLPQVNVQSPPGLDVEFQDSGAGQKTTVPVKTQKGPAQQAQTVQAAPAPKSPPQPTRPPPVAPPHPPAPPPVTTSSAMQDEIQMPDIPLASLPAPPPQPRPQHQPQQQKQRQPQAHEAPRHNARPSPAREQKYMFLSQMSYGNAASSSPPTPNALHGLNMSPAMSDSQAATASDFSVKGNAGAGWDAALRKWVQEHAYYPQAAIEQNQQGTATVLFTVDRHGHVTGVKLLESAGSPFLDQAWFQLFAENTLPPFPPDAKSDHVVVRYTVHYQLVP